MSEPDLLVVGGGILGLSVAMLAAEQGRRVELWRIRDSPVPQADTLRNMAWLHSGLAFSKMDLRLARRIRLARQEMVRGLGLAGALADEPRGIFCVPECLKTAFQENAAKLDKIAETQVQEITYHEAFREVGELAGESGDRHSFFRVPDYAFPEVEVMSSCRSRAIAADVKIYDSERPVRVRRNDSAARGYEIELPNGRRIQPANTLLAAGARLPKMLDDLNISFRYRLSAFVSPILCWRGSWIRPSTRLVHHFHSNSGLSVLSHPADGLKGDDCYLVAGRICEAIQDPERRVVRIRDVDKTIGRFPNGPRSAWRSNPRCYTVTAAHKVGVHVDDRTCPVERPWVAGPKLLLDGLFAAFPGKATMAYHVASRLVPCIFSSTADTASLSEYDAATGSFDLNEPAPGWEDRIKMHWQYDGLDERAAPEVSHV